MTGVTRADFYVVGEQTMPYRFICQLVEKARQGGHEIYIHASSRDEAGTLDDLLWTFKDISFLPHAAIDVAEAVADYPVIIGWEGETPLARAVLINLSGAVPAHLDGCERILEVVPSDPDARRQARARYQDYRDRGLELHSHNIGDARA